MIPFTCPEHGGSLAVRPSPGGEPALSCPSGCTYPLVKGIPRFVPESNYTDAFGLQWKTFRRTQLDSVTGCPITRTRLTRLLGGSIDVEGQNILEAGCGAGRFTEILLEEGGLVHAVDMSCAVEANHENCGTHANHRVCQADIRNLPFQEESFDLVFCVGVVQHTPDPEETMAALCRQVRPGGRLVMDHYTHGYPVTASRKIIREKLLQMPPEFSLSFCEMLVNILWPVHVMLWHNRKIPGFGALYKQFLAHSPLVDYHSSYGELSPEILQSWALLDTHDTVTDRYKHLRSADEIAATLAAHGMVDIETQLAGNGVEARARRPE
ncbi:class I SAM-dependent methyltransferase [Oceanidesulfovibrio marinus]|uniref:Methyltransferase type 11 domain-containing protein n=1 Tax=Oceanidesulfovibrio marinus TaxID=370038 RepID=A0A6P1ZL45_9BACT|nr:class I SAM-dependent methyltransferase [Oceanidesulfovibrio marinus]TVM34456.1 hypothetical protein DQK91_07730 [Oceanidesulfovibrio marinus]